MKILFVTIFVCLLHQILSDECNKNSCQTVKCAQVDVCPAGSYKQLSGHCNCCSSCVTYRKEGESCDVAKCIPELQCNTKTQICESNRCSGVVCKDSAVCGTRRILKKNPGKCRCCDVCALRDDETDDDSRC